MANRVSTTIQARDETGSAFDSLDRRMRNSNLTANLMSSALTGTFGAALSGIRALAGGITGALSSAADTQVSSLSTAGDLMKLTGLGMTETTDIISTFRTEMSKTAASLAGDTKSYTDLGASIMDNLVPAFQAVGGEFDTTGFQKSLQDITKAAGLRAAVNKIDSGLAGLGISKFLGGASTKELTQLKFFEANPAVLAEIEKAAANMGVEIKNLTGKERADILQQALSVPDEVMAAMSTSSSGIIEGFKSSLFDEQSGFFGMLRDLDTSMKGEQSIATGFNAFLKEVSRISTIFSELVGADAPDIMRMAYDGMKAMTDWLKTIQKADVQALISNIQNPGQAITGFINNAVENVKNLFQSFDAVGFGMAMGGLATQMMQNTSAALQGVDWNNVGVVLYEGAKTALEMLAGFLVAAPWGGTLDILWQAAQAVFGILAGITVSLVSDLAAGIGAGIAAIGGALSGLFSSIAGAIGGLLDSARGAVMSLLPTGGGGGAAAAPVKNSAVGNIPSPLLDAFRREQIAMPSGASPTIANTSELILNEKQQAGLLGNLASRGTNVSVGNIIIHAAPGMNEKSIANAVINQLSNMVASTRLNTARA